MNHFYQKIPGWFSFRAVYEQAVKEAKSGAHFVEVGSYMGRSASFMAVEIINSGKKIKFDCVDHWNGSENMQKFREIRQGILFKLFKTNTAPVRSAINIVRCESVDASYRYSDKSLDFVFIDGDHQFKFVYADISAWWPKVKEGGTMAGDDYHFQGVGPAVHKYFDELGIEVEGIKGSGTGQQWRVRKRANDSLLALA